MYKLIRFRRIIVITLLISLINYEQGAHEQGGPVTDKFVYTNIRLTNALCNSEVYSECDRIIESFIRKWNITGASVAVARDGKLVFAKGYGFADTSEMTYIQPFSKFRIASISKLITAIGVMKLAEEGKLSLNDQVFGPEAILDDPFFDNPKDKRVYKITVGHLLSHKGGWSQRYGDQMFMPSVIAREMNVNLPVDLKTIIRFALNKNLHFTPGTGRSYSNLGYSILGLVIEKVSGMPYEEYCRKEIFEPLGMYDMQIAGNMPSERAPYEVTYYEPSNVPLKPSIYGTGEMLPPAYGGNDIRTLGAAGGWLATAPDLMRLLLAVDGFENPPDILSKESINLMTDAYNGIAPMGWKAVVVNGTWWRTGSFPGTAGMLKRQPDGTEWIVLLNCSTWNGPEINTYVNSMMSKVVNRMNWDFDYDLFDFSLPVPLTIHLNPGSIVKTECASP